MAVSSDWFPVDRSGTAFVLVRAAAVVDARTAPVLREVLAGVLRSGRHFVALDLTGSAVYGPRGFSVLIGALKACRDLGGDLYAVGASETVCRVLGHDTRGPALVFGSVRELERAVLGVHSLKGVDCRG